MMYLTILVRPKATSCSAEHAESTTHGASGEGAVVVRPSPRPTPMDVDTILNSPQLQELQTTVVTLQTSMEALQQFKNEATMLLRQLVAALPHHPAVPTTDPGVPGAATPPHTPGKKRDGHAATATEPNDSDSNGNSPDLLSQHCFIQQWLHLFYTLTYRLISNVSHSSSCTYFEP